MRHSHDQPVLFKSKAVAASMGNGDPIITEDELVGYFLLIRFPGLFTSSFRKTTEIPTVSLN